MATVEVFEVQESFLRVWNPFDLYCVVKKPDLTLLHLSKCEVRLVLCDWSNVCLLNECGTHFFEPYESNPSTNCMTINENCSFRFGAPCFCDSTSMHLANRCSTYFPKLLGPIIELKRSYVSELLQLKYFIRHLYFDVIKIANTVLHFISRNCIKLFVQSEISKNITSGHFLD